MAEDRLCACGQPHRHRGHCALRAPPDQARRIDYGRAPQDVALLRAARAEVSAAFAEGRLEDYGVACARLQALLTKT